MVCRGSGSAKGASAALEPVNVRRKALNFGGRAMVVVVMMRYGELGVYVGAVAVCNSTRFKLLTYFISW